MAITSHRMLALCLSFALPLAICTAAENGSRTLEETLRQETLISLAQAARKDGDAIRGAMIFHHSAVTCVACHSVGDRPNAIGPDLTQIDRKTSDGLLIESVLEPSKVIATRYQTLTIETSSGLIVRGVPVEESAEKLVLRDASDPTKLIEIKTAEVAARQKSELSIMPVGQMNLLADRGQFLDLIRYLMALRDGGRDRAQEISRSLELLVQEFPDQPLPNRPVAQRGEIAVTGGAKYPRGLALGFKGSTVLFDADQLCTVASWQNGFVRSSPQNYFGVSLHNVGSAPYQFPTSPHPLSFKEANSSGWLHFELPQSSDPNTGTRFDGYQVGRNSIRLSYWIRVGKDRIRVVEDVRGETRASWTGVCRKFQFWDLPNGSQVAWRIPVGNDYWHAGPEGISNPLTGPDSNAPVVGTRSGNSRLVVHSPSEFSPRWERASDGSHEEWSLISRPAVNHGPVELRIDVWQSRDSTFAITPTFLKELQTTSPLFTDPFDLPKRPASPLPVATMADEPAATAIPSRPAVNSRENVDEFPATQGRLLRFVVTATNDQSAPGIDELEVYGADPKRNLALLGTASASSVIAGYPIHKIIHLNDGKLGNPHSWISAENNGGWAQIEFPEPVVMQKVVWARDRTGVCSDRLPVKYRIEISSDGNNWSRIGDESGRAAPSTVIGTVVRNAAPGYEMESIRLPYPGCRPSDIAFASDGTLYLLSMTEGQIWRGRIPDPSHPNRIRWHRYAAGLYHPIGLALVDDHLYVAQKPEITEVIDRDGDGIVDHYRTVATGWGLSTGWHEYSFGLGVDPSKNIYFALNTGYFWTNPGYVNPGRWRGSVMRISAGTEQLEEVAKGCRVPNGITSGPEGNLFFTDNQGDWIQSCKLAHVIPGRFYGHPELKQDALSEGQFPSGRSAIWFPYQRMRSISGPIYDSTAGNFGPFANQMFVGDVGYGANPGIMRVALEKVEGEYQGACFPFVDNQPLGCERMRFGPDGALYIASLTSGLTRLTYTGKQHTPLATKSIQIRPAGVGFRIELTKPIGVAELLKPEQFLVKRYHYLYSGNYGSPQVDEKNVPVQNAVVSPDRRSIELTFPVEAHPNGMVYEFRIPELQTETGEKMRPTEAWYTVQKIPAG